MKQIITFLLCTAISALPSKTFPACKIPFDRAMKSNPYYPRRSTHHQQWKLAKKQYKQSKYKSVTKSVTYIPKIIHHIWLGSKLPAVSQKFRKTWIDQHPDWKCILWTDMQENFRFGECIENYQDIKKSIYGAKNNIIVGDINQMNFYNQTALEATSNYGEQSDIIRYELLYYLGGLYVDTDFECIASFDIFHNAHTFYAGIGYSTCGGLLNGLIGATPYHPIIESCIKNLQKRNTKKIDKLEVINRTGPGLLTRSFYEYIAKNEDSSCVAYPVTYFYPAPPWIRNSKQNLRKKIKRESYAVHHWHTSWY